MRRPDLRIRLQLTVSVCLFTLICLVSLASAIYVLSRSTLVNLQKGNLDLNCQMRSEECIQEISDVYDTFYRLTYSSSVSSVFSNDTTSSSLSETESMLHDSFGPDRILQLKFYAANGTSILVVNTPSLRSDAQLPLNLLPIEYPNTTANLTLNRTLQQISNQIGLLVGPVKTSQPIANGSYLMSLTLPVRNSTLATASGAGEVIMGFATFLFSARKLELVLAAVSSNSIDSGIGSAALCSANANLTELHQLIPFSNSPTRKQADSGCLNSAANIPIPEKMGAVLRVEKNNPHAEPDQGPCKSMISISQFRMLSNGYYVVVLQGHSGVYAMPHALRNSIFIAGGSIAGAMIIFTFLFVSFGSRQIVRLKMAAKYERPAPTKWRYLPIPWWLRPTNRVEPVEKPDGREYQVPERVSLREHVRDELDDITERFNSMSDELAKQYYRLEDRVRLRKAEIEQAREAADFANAAKSHFLARVTHELRTPLNGIIGTATLCLEEENLTQIHQSLRTIFKCGELLLHLMTDLLSFSQNESDNLKLEPRDFVLPEITSQLTAIFMEQRTAKRIELVVDSDEKLANYVFHGDTTRILQVIFNLITNGIKFTPGGGQVFFKASSQTDADKDNRKVLQFVVRDNGPGIAPEMQTRIFEAFVQGDISTQVKRSGVGLGLSICRQIAQRMHGSVELESKLGEGSTFTFSVPLPCRAIEPESPDSQPNRSLDVVSSSTSLVRSAKGSLLSSPLALSATPPEMPVDPIPPSPGDSTASTGSKSYRSSVGTSPSAAVTAPSTNIGNLDQDGRFNAMNAQRHDVSALPATPRPRMESSKSYVDHPPSHLKVLVVDDNSVNQEVMMRMLNLEGLKNIVVADDGVDSIEKVKKSIEEGEPFDVIFMDVQMPNMDGREATRVIRKEFNFQRPIVAVSAFANEQNADDCIAAGMNLFLSKPLRRPHLREILKDLVGLTAGHE